MSEVLGVKMPAPAAVTPLNVDMTEFIPVVERRPDTVVRIHSETGKAEGLRVLAAALETTDKETASDLSEFTEAGLGSTPGFEIWRTLMASGTFNYVSETRARGRAEGLAEGEARGEAKSILLVLKSRGIAVDDHSLRRIQACTDQDLLEKWLCRTPSVDKVEQLFEG